MCGHDGGVCACHQVLVIAGPKCPPKARRVLCIQVLCIQVLWAAHLGV